MLAASLSDDNASVSGGCLVVECHEMYVKVKLVPKCNLGFFFVNMYESNLHVKE